MPTSCISGRSYTGYTKNEYTFRLSNILIICFCNSSANYWFDIFPFLTASPEADLSASEADFLSKNLKTIEARSLLYPSYFEFLVILNASSCNVLSEAVLLVKPLNSP